MSCTEKVSAQAAQAYYVWVRASEVIWLEYTRIISVLHVIRALIVRMLSHVFESTTLRKKKS